MFFLKAFAFFECSVSHHRYKNLISMSTKSCRFVFFESTGLTIIMTLTSNVATKASCKNRQICFSLLTHSFLQLHISYNKCEVLYHEHLYTKFSSSCKLLSWFWYCHLNKYLFVYYATHDVADSFRTEHKKFVSHRDKNLHLSFMPFCPE